MIRKAEPTDLDAVRRCATRAYAIYVERIGRKPAPMVADFAVAIASGSVYLDVDENGALRGYVVCYPRGDHVHLENVAVDPEHQAKGIGPRLVEQAERLAHDAGLDRVELYTNAKMTENLAFYPALGYRQTDRRIEDGFERVFFSKRLG